jgi:hypothetical protein
MINKKWFVLSASFILVALYLTLNTSSVRAACTIDCDAAGKCVQSCNEMGCTPKRMSCPTTCGQEKKCTDDGCGGKNCCMSTAACVPTVSTSTCVPACTSGYSCVKTESCPPGVNCIQNKIIPKCILNTPIPPRPSVVATIYPTRTRPSSIPTVSKVYCGANNSCPAGQECVMPTRYPCERHDDHRDNEVREICNGKQARGECRPTDTKSICPLRPQGDANCNKEVNDADYVIFTQTLNGAIKQATGAIQSKNSISADFNADGKVNLVDFEIWRKTVYK